MNNLSNALNTGMNGYTTGTSGQGPEKKSDLELRNCGVGNNKVSESKVSKPQKAF